MGKKGRALTSSLALLAGIVAAGLMAQGAGLDTQNVPVAFAVVAVGVLLGVGLGKILLRR